MYKETFRVDPDNENYSVTRRSRFGSKKKTSKKSKKRKTYTLDEMAEREKAARRGDEKRSKRAEKKRRKEAAKTSKWVQKRKARRIRNFRIFAVVLIIFCILFALGYFLFRTEEVEIEGNEIYSDEMISAQIFNDDYSWNGLYVYLREKFVKRDDVPFIDEVEVTLEGRKKLHIEVYEKPMIGCIRTTSGEYAYFDKEGIVCEISKETVDGIPKIKGISVTETKLYKKLETDDETVFRTILNLVNLLDKYDISSKEVSFASDGEMTVKFGDIKVLLGTEDNLPDKIMRLSLILPELEDESGTLHLEDFSLDNTDIVFKKE